MRQPDIHGVKRFIRPVTYGVLFGAGACLLILVFASLVMGFQDLPQPVVSLVATLAFVVGGLVAGFVSAALAREKGLLLGLFCGACLFVILSLASLAIDGPAFGAAAFTKLVAVMLAAALGGVIGVNRRKAFAHPIKSR